MRPFILCVAAVMAAACSIKEDRGFCPSEVGLAVSAPPQVLGRKIVLRVWEEAALLQDNFLYGGGWQDRSYRLPRKQLAICSVCGIRGRGTRYCIDPGKQCDSIYSAGMGMHPSGEKETDSLRLHKQFATVFMVVTGDLDGDGFPYRIRVVGNTSGLDLLDSAPLEGPFFFEPEFSASLKAGFRLPRQADDSLRLEFLSRENGKILFVEEAGRQIADSGYDWTAPDLEDITILMTLTSVGVEIRVGTWDARAPIEVEI